MPIRSRHVAVIATTSLVLAFACDRSPTSPPLPQQPGQTTTPVVLVRVEVVAPQEIAPDESVQLTANAIRSDGSVQNVTAQAQWTPTSSQIVQLTSTGLATGKNRGEQFVQARFSGRSGSARIFVLPKGTFKLAGSVKESGFGIDNVSVTVISGVGAGLTTTTVFGGSYALFGVSGPVQIHLKKQGYLNAAPQVDVTAHRTADFEIVPERARNDYRGIYTLTITAASPCRFSTGTLPDAAKRRVYTANVAQDGARLTVALTGADFIVTNGHGNGFAGFVDTNDAIRFTIGDAFYYYYYYGGSFDIVERFDGISVLMTGIASTRGTPTLISGTLSGSIVTTARTGVPFTPFSSQCHGDTHGFEMVRR